MHLYINLIQFSYILAKFILFIHRATATDEVSVSQKQAFNPMKQDIQNIADIKILVDQFYSAVRQDTLLGPIFQERIQDNWGVHLEKMYRFWQTILLDEHTYFGSPFPPHIPLSIEAKHFDQWLLLFEATVDRLYTGEKADEAKWRAQKMAQMFQFKKEYFNANPKKKPLI